MTKKRLIFLGLAVFLTVGASITPGVLADQYDDAINALNNENANKQHSVGQLGAEAANLQDTIAKLRAQITGLQAQITDSEQKREATTVAITNAEADLAKQKGYLSDSVKASYVDGSVSSLEMLASSQSINQFVDQQQYQNSVQGQVQRTLDTIKQLQQKLALEKTNLDRIIADLGNMRTSLAGQQAEQSRLLSLNQEQQNALDAQIKANTARANDLRQEQIIANAGLSMGKPGTGANCGGGYPGSASNDWGGVWGCNYGLDQGLDKWGMYNRECVSYTAFRVAASGRYMPKWGSQGIGNAKQWDDNARASGIPVDSNPRRGDIAVSNYGDYGHVMYVEAVAGDGSIYVSDYNQQWDGRYREYWISADTVRGKSLVFIHF